MTRRPRPASHEPSLFSADSYEHPLLLALACVLIILGIPFLAVYLDDRDECWRAPADLPAGSWDPSESRTRLVIDAEGNRTEVLEILVESAKVCG